MCANDDDDPMDELLHWACWIILAAAWGLAILAFGTLIFLYVDCDAI